MASEELKLTAQIVISHASMTELSPQELVEEIKEIYYVLASLDGGTAAPEAAVLARGEAEGVKKPSIPLKDIVKDKYVVCLECGKKMRTLKAHIRKAHGLGIFQTLWFGPQEVPPGLQGVLRTAAEVSGGKGSGSPAG